MELQQNLLTSVSLWFLYYIYTSHVNAKGNNRTPENQNTLHGVKTKNMQLFLVIHISIIKTEL